ncbi:MAG: hypothetical protein ACJ73S_12100 [Mycobacteriales bacterium]
MVEEPRRYRYVGPPDLRAAAPRGESGRPIRSGADFDAWAATVPDRDLAEPFTFVVDTAGTLRLAPRRSEHVACAGGGEVLAAGEIAFACRPSGWAVTEVTNQSTGYCPDASCWPAVAAALDHAGLPHPPAFTAALTFRRCPDCGERNVVKDDDFTCAVCGGDLPRRWNVAPDT